MARIVYLPETEMTRFCYDYLYSVLQEMGQQVTPIWNRMEFNRDAWESAEAEMDKAAQAGDFKKLVALCDAYLRRVELTVKKWGATQEASIVVDSQRRANNQIQRRYSSNVN